MKLNQDKFLLLVSGYKHEDIWPRISEVKIWESLKEKLLGVVIDGDLTLIRLGFWRVVFPGGGQFDPAFMFPEELILYQYNFM